MRHNILDDKNFFHCNLTIKRRIDYSREFPHDKPIAAKDDIVELFDDI